MMAGPFAHMILVDTLCQDASVLDSIDTLTKKMKQGLMKFPKFCELGAASPDCPYLKLLSEEAARWGNIMHYWKTADFIRRAVPYVHNLDWRSADTLKCFAWLFGYTAHVVTDSTVHPVVNLRVGPYEQNKKEHRRCELHQDTYIFQKLTEDDIGTAEYVRRCGIGSCADPTNRHRLDPAISELWRRGLKGVPLGSVTMKGGLLPAPESPPDPDDWFRHYVKMLDKFAEEGGRVPRLCREIGEDAGLFYPEFREVDQSYIEKLPTPDNTTTDYDQLFERAQQNVRSSWRELGAALDSGDENLFTLANVDLDTGLAEDGSFVHWRNNA